LSPVTRIVTHFWDSLFTVKSDKRFNDKSNRIIINERELDIVDLIENDLVRWLTGKYQNKMIEKIKENFNNMEQQIFVASFYSFLKYDSKKDFVIDLDKV
jgi:hypothetical protein